MENQELSDLLDEYQSEHDDPDMPEMNQEQQDIVDAAEQGYNIIVNAVAGAGKTTTIFYIANKMKTKKILTLTYSSRLKKESRAKKDKYGQDNMEIHSFHSFGRIYLKTCFTDDHLESIIGKNTPPKNLDCYDILIIDEVQDMTSIYYNFVMKILRDHNTISQIIIFGDKDQNINSYKGADKRYLLLGDIIYPGKKWQKMPLNTSFRLSKQTADFVNCCMGFDKIKTIKTGLKPEYYCIDRIYGSGADKAVGIIFGFIQEYGPENIFLLAASVKKSENSDKLSPQRHIANKLTEKQVNIYVPDKETENVEECLYENKLVFSTFHGTKGLERDVVIILGFDSGYFEFYSKNDDISVCPNTLYVAMTRARSRLVLIHYNNKPILKFVRPALKFCEVSGEPKHGVITRNNNVEIIFDVTRFLRQIGLQIRTCIKIRGRTLNPAAKAVGIANISKQVVDDKIIYEDVCTYNGIAIPAYYEFKKRGTISIFGEKCADKFKNNCSIPALLRESVYYCKDRHKYECVTRQINKYDWISRKALNQLMNNFEEIFGKYYLDTGIFERYVSCKFMHRGKSFEVRGSIDYVDENGLWEFKCVNNIVIEHKIQLLAYAYLYEMSTSITPPNLYLFNIKTREFIQLKYIREDCKKLFEEVFDNYISAPKNIEDDEFVSRCLSKS